MQTRRQFRKLIPLGIVLGCVVPNVSFGAAPKSKTEREYQESLCKDFDTNVFLKDSGTYVDCLSKTHAIEVDFSVKWAEAVGQSLHYASTLRKTPGVIIICKPTTVETICVKHSYLAEQAFVYYGIRATLWLCKTSATFLAECSRVEIGSNLGRRDNN